MKKLLMAGLAYVGAFVALVSSTGCWLLYADEPSMPEEML